MRFYRSFTFLASLAFISMSMAAEQVAPESASSPAKPAEAAKTPSVPSKADDNAAGSATKSAAPVKLTLNVKEGTAWTYSADAAEGNRSVKVDMKACTNLEDGAKEKVTVAMILNGNCKLFENPGCSGSSVELKGAASLKPEEQKMKHAFDEQKPPNVASFQCS